MAKPMTCWTCDNILRVQHNFSKCTHACQLSSSVAMPSSVTSVHSKSTCQAPGLYCVKLPYGGSSCAGGTIGCAVLLIPESCCMTYCRFTTSSVTSLRISDNIARSTSEVVKQLVSAMTMASCDLGVTSKL